MNTMSENMLNRRELCQLLAAGPGGLALMAASARGDGGAKNAPKVLMPIGDATEAMDTLYPYFRSAEDDFRVVVAGPASVSWKS